MSKLFLTLMIALFAFVIAPVIWHSETQSPRTSKDRLPPPSVLPVIPSDTSKSTPIGSQTTVPTVPKDDSELDLAITGNVSLLLADSAGRRTGRDLTSGSQLQEIPNSAYFEDSLSEEVSPIIEIPQPQEEEYQIIVTGLGNGASYKLSIRAFSRNGDSQPELTRKGNLTQGSRVNFILKFTSTPGNISTLQ